MNKRKQIDLLALLAAWTLDPIEPSKDRKKHVKHMMLNLCEIICTTVFETVGFFFLGSQQKKKQIASCLTCELALVIFFVLRQRQNTCVLPHCVC